LDVSEEQPAALARTLFAAATEGGARALGLDGASLVEGGRADFFAVDLDDPSLVGRPSDLLATLVFGGQARAITDVMVDGRFVLRDRIHGGERDIGRRYQALAEVV
jgi:formimidoylglutamate deiminase